MSTSVSLKIAALACAACKAPLGSLLIPPLKQLGKAGGRCPACGHGRFDATLTKTTVSRMDEEPEEVADIVIGALLGAPAAGLPEDAPSSLSVDYELSGVEGMSLLALADRPAEEVWEWLRGKLKEDARAHLRPDQGLCRTCGEIFTRASMGPAAEGFCSLLCKKKARPPAATPAGPASKGTVRSLVCPACRKALKVKTPAGAETHCLWCGAVFTA